MADHTPGRIVPAHDQKVSHSYIITFPAHAPRDEDPHKADFEEWKRRRRENNTYYCDFAHDHRGGDANECDMDNPLEAHHNKVELAMMNEIDFSLLDGDFPGINADTVGAWIDSDRNLTLLCRNHHRGAGGIHDASYSDFTAEFYVRHLIRSTSD
jgi:hypothetical protein